MLALARRGGDGPQTFQLSPMAREREALELGQQRLVQTAQTQSAALLLHKRKDVGAEGGQAAFAEAKGGQTAGEGSRITAEGGQTSKEGGQTAEEGQSTLRERFSLPADRWLTFLQREAHTLCYRKGECVVAQNEPCDALFQIARGAVRIEKTTGPPPPFTHPYPYPPYPPPSPQERSALRALL